MNNIHSKDFQIYTCIQYKLIFHILIYQTSLLKMICNWYRTTHAWVSKGFKPEMSRWEEIAKMELQRWSIWQYSHGGIPWLLHNLRWKGEASWPCLSINFHIIPFWGQMLTLCYWRKNGYVIYILHDFPLS